MSTSRAASWIPAAAGVATTLIALTLLRELVYVPEGEILLLGTVLTGRAAWFAACAQVVLLFAFALGCFTRRRAVIWPLIAYCGYWIASIWIWAWTYLSAEHNMARSLTAALPSILLLVVCRTLLTHREQFRA